MSKVEQETRQRALKEAGQVFQDGSRACQGGTPLLRNPHSGPLASLWSDGWLFWDRAKKCGEVDARKSAPPTGETAP